VLRRSPVTLFAALFFPLFLLFASTASYDGRQVNDAIAAAIPAWTLANDGTLTIPDDAPVNVWFVDAGGRRVSNRFPGTIAVAVPFYWLTRGSAPRPTVPEASLAAAFVSALAVSLMAFALRRVASTRVAVAGALLLGLGTTTWTVSAATLMTHGPAQLWLTLGLLAAASARWWLSTPAYAAAVLTRPHLVVVPVVAAAWHVLRDRLWRAAFWLLLGALAGVALLLAYNHHVYGRWSLQGGYAITLDDALTRSPTTLAGNVAGALFSPARGLLGYSPFVLLLLLGVPRAWRAAPSWARGAALGSVAYLLLQMQANRFSGGAGFYGYRLPLEPLTLATPLLAVAYTEWVAPSAWRRRAFGVLVAYSVAVQVLGAFWFGPGWHGTGAPWTSLVQVRAAREAGVLGVLLAVVAGVAFAVVAGRATRRTGDPAAA
jgi:alpha-1,2-mannosyltransferase